MFFCFYQPYGSAGLLQQLLFTFCEFLSHLSLFGFQLCKARRSIVLLLSALSSQQAGVGFDDSLFDFHHATAIILYGNQ